MRILLIDKGGQLGHHLSPISTTLGTVVSIGREGLNLERPDAIRQTHLHVIDYGRYKAFS